MLWEHVAAEVERGIEEGHERRIIKADNKAKKKKAMAKKSKDDEDVAVATACAKVSKDAKRIFRSSVRRV